MVSSSVPVVSRPVGDPDPPRPAVRRLQVPQLAIGVLLSGLAALGFLVFHAMQVQREPVLALATDVVRGQVLTAEDLRVVEVGTEGAVAVTPVADSALLVGQAAVADLPAGTLLTEAQVTSGATLTPGAGVVGLALAPGQYPTPRLAVGDLVSVVEVADTPAVLVETAEVVGFEAVGTQGQQFVSVQTSELDATAVAGAAAAGEVRLVLVARAGEDSPDDPDAGGPGAGR